MFDLPSQIDEWNHSSSKILNRVISSAAFKAGQLLRTPIITPIFLLVLPVEFDRLSEPVLQTGPGFPSDHALDL